MFSDALDGRRLTIARRKINPGPSSLANHDDSNAHSNWLDEGRPIYSHGLVAERVVTVLEQDLKGVAVMAFCRASTSD